MGGLVGPGFIKFFVSAGLLHCPVAVNLHRAEAVLDPLLATSMVSSRFAERLHLPREGRSSISAYGISTELATTGPVSIEIHPAMFELPRLAIENGEIERRAPAKADIILGADALASSLLRLDMRRRQLSAISSSDAQRSTKGMMPVAIRLDQAGHLLFSARIGNAAPVWAILDLGSDIPVVISPKAAAAEGLNSPEDVSIADVPFGPKPVHVRDEDQNSIVIGGALFSDRVIILDVSGKKIWVSK